MHEIGLSLTHANIEKIYFVHGTFTGDDPLGLLSLMKLGKISRRLDRKVRRAIKLSTDKVMKDVANFSQRYVELAEQALEIPCSSFTWSSTNHHYARVKAAVNLISHLIEDPSVRGKPPGSKVLLVGHSHAGQVFAIFSRLLNQRDHESLIGFIGQHLQPLDRLEHEISILRSYKFLYTTLGTPPRYSWGHNPGELLQIVNHTQTDLTMPGLVGITRTSHGDYVQKFAQPGSDTAATVSPKEKELNKYLDEILGVGLSKELALANIRQPERPLGEGFTLLVNFQEQNKLPKVYPLASVLGHGVYTRLEWMFLIFSLISERFTPKQEPE